MSVTVTVDDRKLQEAFKKITAAARGQIMVSAAEAGGYVVEGQAKINAPVDMGYLRNSIQTKTGRVTATEANVHVGPAAEYGAYVEFGTGIHAEDGKGRKKAWVYWSDKLQQFITTSGTRPRSFLRPALKERKGQIIEAIRRTAARLILGAVGR